MDYTCYCTCSRLVPTRLIKVRIPSNTLGSCAVVVFVPSGATSCETIPTVFVVCSPSYTRGNEVRIVLAVSSIVKTTENVREKPEVEHHLRMEKARSSLCIYMSKVFGPRVDFPLHRDTNEN
jgi:hypothetical protein